MLSFWQSLDTEWKHRFCEHSVRNGNSLIFEISKAQKEYMENYGNLQYELYYPISVKYEEREDGGYNCIVTYDDFDKLSWCGEFDDEEELNNYIKKINE